MLRVAADGGDGEEVPPVALDRLVITAASLIDDMEDKEQIMDRCAPCGPCWQDTGVASPDVMSVAI